MDCASPHAAPHAAAHATLLAAPPPDPNPNPNPNRTARHTGLPKTPGSSHCPYPYPNPIAARASLDGRLKSLPSRLIAACHTQHQRECTVFPRRRPAPRRPAANRLATRHTPHNTQHTPHAARRTPHATQHTPHATPVAPLPLIITPSHTQACSSRSRGRSRRETQREIPEMQREIPWRSSLLISSPRCTPPPSTRWARATGTHVSK